MTVLEIEGVGIFYYQDGYWRGEPNALKGSSIEFDGELVTDEQRAFALYISTHWHAILKTCAAYVEEERARYGLDARELTDPDVIVSSEDWTVFFSTESESEAIVGVEFRDRTPFQLIIGD